MQKPAPGLAALRTRKPTLLGAEHFLGIGPKAKAILFNTHCRASARFALGLYPDPASAEPFDTGHFGSSNPFLDACHKAPSVAAVFAARTRRKERQGLIDRTEAARRLHERNAEAALAAIRGNSTDGRILPLLRRLLPDAAAGGNPASTLLLAKACLANGRLRPAARLFQTALDNRNPGSPHAGFGGSDPCEEARAAFTEPQDGDESGHPSDTSVAEAVLVLGSKMREFFGRLRSKSSAWATSGRLGRNPEEWCPIAACLFAADACRNAGLQTLADAFKVQALGFWSDGVVAAPEAFSLMTRIAPDAGLDRRISALAEMAGLPEPFSAKRKSKKPNPHPQADRTFSILVPLAADACSDPDARCDGGKTLWEAFHALVAHEKSPWKAAAEKHGPLASPIAPGFMPALWSLAGDGKLLLRACSASSKFPKPFPIDRSLLLHIGHNRSFSPTERRLHSSGDRHPWRTIHPGLNPARWDDPVLATCADIACAIGNIDCARALGSIGCKTTAIESGDLPLGENSQAEARRALEQTALDKILPEAASRPRARKI